MELRDKIAGALYGMALGDAMGMPAELWGRERARKFFGGKLTEFIDGPKENDVAFNYNKAQFTDDTGQAMVLQTLQSVCWNGLKKRMHFKIIF